MGEDVDLNFLLDPRMPTGGGSEGENGGVNDAFPLLQTALDAPKKKTRHLVKIGQKKPRVLKGPSNLQLDLEHALEPVPEGEEDQPSSKSPGEAMTF